MKAILLDIEGTVTDKAFVTDTLFPFARTRIASFIALHANEPEVRAAIELMREKLGQTDASVESIGAALETWIEEDRKEEPLKTLQGLIWKEGFVGGSLVAHIYPEVPAAFARWRANGQRLAIFSSGSIGAQKLLFAHTLAGDLTPYLQGHFDLSSGPKMEAASYTKIAEALNLPPTDVKFYSDVPLEVEAAIASGMEAVLVERDGPIEATGNYHRITDFSKEV